MSVFDAIRAFWLDESLGDGRVLVGFSGGPDSTALLHGLASLRAELGVEPVAAHLHHGIRGEQADADLEACRDFTRRLGVEFVSDRFDVPAFALRARGLGIEAVGRMERYSFFHAAAERVGCRWIATGHTLDDHVETVLLNLARGTGLRGLRGIPSRRDKIIRPLLSVRRAETRRYCETHGLSALEDETNRDPRFARNRLRLILEGELSKALGDKLYESVQRLARIAEAEDAFLDDLTENALAGAVRPQHWLVKELDLEPREFVLGAERLVSQPLALQRRAIRALITRVDDSAEPGFEVIESALAAAREGRRAGYAISASSVELVVTPGLVVVREQPEPERVDVPLEFGSPVKLHGLGCVVEFTAGPIPASVRGFQRLEAVFDRECVTGTLRVVVPARGRYRPLGFDGTREVRDLLSSEGVPGRLRPLVPALEDDDGPVWVLGSRIAERVRVTASTRAAGYVRVRQGPTSVQCRL